MSKTQLIPGPAGNLEIYLEIPGEFADDHPVAVICHPHPLYSGSMTNKVVHMLASSLLKQGIPCLRFNFRGVGQSEGEFDDAVGEVEDLKAAANWIKQRYPGHPLWLAGFSFGSYIALKGHAELDAARLITVAPPVTLYDFEQLPPVNIPWLVVQGGADEVVDPEQVRDWLASRGAGTGAVGDKQLEIAWLEDTSHFFHGKLNQLREVILSWNVG